MARIERPLGAAALASAVRAGLRARRKQYELRAYLAERETAAARLATLNASLETRVAERTVELRAAYDRLAEEGRQREQAEAQLAQAQRMEALGQLAGGIAHDFNNMLQAVIGGLSLIPTRVGRRRRRQRRQVLVRSDTDRDPAAQCVRQHLVQPLQQRVGQLADKAQLETVLVNLAVNARDAMPEGGTLLLAAVPEAVLDAKAHPASLAPGSYLRLSVTDTGTGMNAATLARASEPFFTTKLLGQGTGLGLAMARGFAHQSTAAS